MKHVLRLALGVGAFVAAASSASAAQLVVANADFEQGFSLGEGGYLPGHFLPVPGWTDSGGSGTGLWNPTSSDFAGQAGPNLVGYAQGNGNLVASNSGTLAQRIANHALQANTRYTLSFDVGRRFGTDPFHFAAGLLAGSLAGGPVDLLQAISGSQDHEGAVIPMGQFRTVRLVYQTGASGAALGRDLSIAFSSNGTGAAFDNFVLDASPMIQSAVPEPATWAMMIAGFGLMGGAMRRRSAGLALAQSVS
jgi:hypothetical protein